jgi:hypothetical protein
MTFTRDTGGMRFAGRESWQVSHGTSHTVNTALFVRDTLALSVETVPELPGLDPSVPVVVPAGVDRAAAAEEWLGWWADVLDHARAELAGGSPADPAGASLQIRPARPSTTSGTRRRGARCRSARWCAGWRAGSGGT